MKKLYTNTASHGATMMMALMANVFLVGGASYGAGKVSAPVLLGKAGEYVILAKTGITTTGITAITGNVGVSPTAASSMTGFSLSDPPSTYSTSPIVTGKVYAADYDSPTPANLITAVLDMQAAYTDASGRAADSNELGAGNIGGMTLAPAVYKWGGNVLITSDVTLSGDANAIWIFQIAGNLTLNSGIKIALDGGALAKNIFWQVAGAVDLETTAHFEGIALSQTGIVLKTGATANGRLLAQTAVPLDANTVAEPGAPVPIVKARIASKSFVVKMSGSAISFPLPQGNGVRVSIVDVWGRTVWSKTVEAARGLREMTWDATTSSGTPAANGAYMVRFVSLDESRRARN